MNNAEFCSRNYGIDLLRLISMFMIVVLHVLLRGGVLNNTEFLSIEYKLAWFVECAALCAVNIYALISGYVGVYSKQKYTNIILLWLQTVFYTVSITLIFLIFDKTFNEGRSIYLKMFMPVSTGQYWYFTAYFAMFFFLPGYNFVLEHMPRIQIKTILIAGFALFSVIPTFLKTDIYGLNWGYSFLWLSYLYVLGGYFKKYDIGLAQKKGKWLLNYIVCAFIIFLEKIVSEVVNLHATGDVIRGGLFIDYTSPMMVLSAVSLLFFFINMKISLKYKNIIKITSASAFGVYLIHAHPLIYERILANKFSGFSNVHPIKMLAGVLFSALIIFLLCLFTDMIREFIFKKIRLKERLLRKEVQYVKKEREYK